jgi:hypothetical protein
VLDIKDTIVSGTKNKLTPMDLIEEEAEMQQTVSLKYSKC